ncbi:MAG: sugar transferase [Clostridia bacterium]|nr:sugar transferase [Clostridia bacterium]
MHFSYARIKRVLDIVYASAGLLLSAVPLSCIAAAVKATSKGPFIFRQIRIGRNGIPFVCYKVRTMKNGAPQCPAAKLQNRASFITPIGAFLRNHSLDELTQFANVLRGEMSVIGPRPLIPEERELHRLRTEKGVYTLRPGISGLSQISGRDDLPDKRKARLDAIYLENASLWLDFAILARTMRCLHHETKNRTPLHANKLRKHTKKRANSLFFIDKS